MHGLINRSIQFFISETYGRSAWLGVVGDSGVGIGDFEALMVYDDAVTDNILTAAEQALDKPRSGLLEDMGTWLVTKRQPETVRRLLRFGGVDFVEFLHSLDDLPGRIRLAVGDLALPSIDVCEEDPASYRIGLGESSPDFLSVLRGVVQAMADDYGALAVIGQASGDNRSEMLSVQVFQADYAEGHAFQLAGAE